MKDGGSFPYNEDDLLPISGLQHVTFCERRAALNLIEGLWSDNVATVEGSLLHGRADDLEGTESRGGLRIARSLRLRSFTLGVSGIADVVEFHREKDSRNNKAEASHNSGPNLKLAKLNGVQGLWRPYPVEYKRGNLREEESFEIQLCAQAICLEEMLGCNVPKGAIYYGKPRKRLEIEFTGELRNNTKEAAMKLRALMESKITPRASYEKKCNFCSLFEVCLPKSTGIQKKASAYVAKLVADSLKE